MRYQSDWKINNSPPVKYMQYSFESMCQFSTWVVCRDISHDSTDSSNSHTMKGCHLCHKKTICYYITCSGSLSGGRTTYMYILWLGFLTCVCAFMHWLFARSCLQFLRVTRYRAMTIAILIIVRYSKMPLNFHTHSMKSFHICTSDADIFMVEEHNPDTDILRL